MRISRQLGSWLLVGYVCVGIGPASASGNTTPSSWTGSLAERIEAARAIERIYWVHRQATTAGVKSATSFDQTISDSLLEDRIRDEDRKIAALDSMWNARITELEVQRELNRIARDTKMPERLAEMFAALGNDPDRIADVLIRPRLVDARIRARYAEHDHVHDTWKEPFESWWSRVSPAVAPSAVAPSRGITLPSLTSSCTPDTWSTMLAGFPEPRADHAVAWTGSEMIFWGGTGNHDGGLRDGWRYDPAADTWSRIADPDPALVPQGVYLSAWTGSELIILDGNCNGAIYNPASNAWRVMQSFPRPNFSDGAAAVWTGSELLVWDADQTDDDGLPIRLGWRYQVATDSWTPMSTSGAPSPRGLYLVAWTGQRMVIWGGQAYDANLGHMVALKTGGRYDPTTDHWSATNLSGAPEARLTGGHGAVWTGTEMIFWGGLTYDADGNGYFPVVSGGRYDPVQNHWTSMTTSGAPSSLWDNHTAVWTGSRMLVWGGAGETAPGIPDGGSYDPVTDHWSSLSTAGTAARGGHTAVWTGSRMIVWGGASGEFGSMTDTGGSYDPATDTWTPTASTFRPLARSEHAAIWTGAELVIWSGAPYDDGHATNSGGRYDPALDSWTPTSLVGAPAGRLRPKAVWTGNRILVWGGYLRNPQGSRIAFDTGGDYDPAADQWTPISMDGAPAPRWDHAAVWTGEEMVVWGGQDASGSVNSGGRYSPATDSWLPVSTVAAPFDRISPATAWTGREVLVAAGSYDGSLTGARYSPALDLWTPIAADAIPPGIWGQPWASAWSGTEMLFHGRAGDYRYDPDHEVWTPFPYYELGGTPTGTWSCDQFPVWNGTRSARYLPAQNAWSPISTVNMPPISGYVYLLPSSETGMFVSGYGTDHGGFYCACASPAPLGVPRAYAEKSGGTAAEKSSGTARVAWSSIPFASAYDVVRGDLDLLRSSRGDFSLSTRECLSNDCLLTHADDPDEPALGRGFWYLVRAVRGVEHTSYDDGTASQAAPRDAGIAASGMACP